MIYMKSTSGNDGSYNLTVSFQPGTDPDIDTVNVNNRVQTALAQLAAGGAASGPDRAEALGRGAAVHVALQRRRQARPDLHHQLRHDQRPRRTLARAGGRPGAAVRQAQLLDAHLVRHAAPDQPEPVALRRGQRDPGAERPGAGRAHRRAPGRQRPAVPDERADAGSADHAGAVRRHRPARQSRRFGGAPARRGARRNGGAERGRRRRASTAGPRSASRSISRPTPTRCAPPAWSIRPWRGSPRAFPPASRRRSSSIPPCSSATRSAKC